jgi:hypothetical protein
MSRTIWANGRRSDERYCKTGCHPEGLVAVQVFKSLIGSATAVRTEEVYAYAIHYRRLHTSLARITNAATLL